MSSLESSTEQGGDDHNDQAESRPKILTDEEKLEPVASSLKPEKEGISQELSDTKLTNQVVEPMSRSNDKEMETLEEQAVNGEVKTNIKKVLDDVRNLTRDGSMNPHPGFLLCFFCCAFCHEGCAFVLCLPCLAVAKVRSCIVRFG
ncbi:hypothetical protein AgCh_040283 [Apium graveolens]